MKLISLIMKHKLYSFIVVLLSLILVGEIAVYQLQAENQRVLQQLLRSEKSQPSLDQDIKQLIPLLKSIQATQAEQNRILTQLVTTKPEPHKEPVSKMKKFKHGAYKPAKAIGY
jgi:biopolymer transport protein ExbB/TolQ